LPLNIYIGRDTRSVKLGNGGWSKDRTAASHRAIAQSAFTEV